MRNRLMPAGCLRQTIGLLALVAALHNVGLAAAQTASSDPAAGKHYTKEAEFHLPISIQDRLRGSIREVQLFVKTPGGEWQRREIAPASQKAFTFRAPADGEYWFTLVTVDGKGVASPSDLTRLTPEDIVMVIVDTQPPVFDLQPMKVASGDLLLRCVVNDANPDYTQVRITYRSSDRAAHALQPQPGMVGTFRVPGPEVFANPIRVVVTDLAGNITAKDVDLRESVAKLWPAPQQAPVVPEGHVRSQLSPVALQAAEVSTATVSTPPVVQGSSLSAQAPPLAQSFESRAVPQPVVVTSSPVVASNQMATSNQAASNPAVSGAIQRQFINTTRASLDYRIDQVGPSGVGKVEVWMTSDQGASWKRLCNDADRRSPAEFDLPGDGLYGVRVVVTNGNGFGGRAPVPGEQPQLWIEVDTVAPTVQLKEVEPSTNGGTIDLRWLASDKNLSSEPINLYYATRREGPWLPVARGLKNDGVHRWSFPRDMGPQFFVRLEAVDMAGNLARCETSSAIVLDMTEPRTSVIGVTGIQGQPVQARGNQ